MGGGPPVLRDALAGLVDVYGRHGTVMRALADAAMDEYMLAECGYEQVEAVGVDYAYEGIPGSVPAGTPQSKVTEGGR